MLSLFEQIDGLLKGTIDPKRSFAIDELNGSSTDKMTSNYLLGVHPTT